MAGKDYGVVIIRVLSGPLAGRTLSALGEVKIKPSGYKIGGEVSVDHQEHNRSFEPVPVVAMCDFSRGDVDWDALANARFDMTWEEPLANLIHYMTQAALVGEQQDSMKDGKSTGHEVQCTKPNYRKRAI
jgi:hypothetical protein